MNLQERKQHWETIYQNKQLTEVSWYQPTPETSLSFFEKYAIAKSARIIDIGGGDSFLVDHLLELGYTNITVLDISQKAIDRAKARLGENAKKATWIVSDITEFQPQEKYDLWHDRAAFHFLTSREDIQKYIDIAHHAISENGHLIIGTFSENGPKKCSGIDIKQYSESSLEEQLKNYFHKKEAIIIDHKTPFDTIQNFLFSSFSPM